VSELKVLQQHDSLLKVEDGTEYDADDEGTGLKSDTVLMPPPPLPTVGKDDSTSEHEATSADGRRRKLDTPLAAMLPSKYQNVDVTEIFPDFRVDKVWHLLHL
jgi:transcription initiation factor TFIID subunit 1